MAYLQDWAVAVDLLGFSAKINEGLARFMPKSTRYLVKISAWNICFNKNF